MACPRRCSPSEAARQSCPAEESEQPRGDQTERRSAGGRDPRCLGRLLVRGTETLEKVQYVFKNLIHFSVASEEGEQLKALSGCRGSHHWFCSPHPSAV